MQMLQAGGMKLLTDELRAADQHNPRGYLEYEPVKRSGADVSWLERAGGRAVKVIHLLLRHLPADRPSLCGCADHRPVSRRKAGRPHHGGCG